MDIKKRPIMRAVSLLAGKKGMFFMLLGLVVGWSAFDLVVPIVSQRLVDGLISFFQNGGAAPVSLLAWSSIAILGATVVSRLLEASYRYRFFLAATSLEDEVRHEAFRKFLNLHALFHHGSSSGQIIGRIESGAVAIFTVLYQIVGQLFLPPVTIFIGVFGVLLYKNPLIALVVFLPLPVYLLSVRNITNRIYETEKTSSERFESVSKHAYDVAGNVLTVKKFSQEDAEAGQADELRSFAREAQYSSERLWRKLDIIQTVISTFGRVSVILLSGFLVFRGQISVGEFVLYIALQGMAYGPLTQLANVFPRSRRNAARIEKLFAIIDEEEHVKDMPGAADLGPISGGIKFDNVSFKFSETGEWALRNLTIEIPAGKTLALVGRSGSGKTTFVNLLLRSYDPQEGKITLDGKDLREVTKKSLLEQTAVVPQEVDLFSRTIRENIAYGISDAATESIEHAAKVALAHDFIMKTENGYDTVVGERGIKLSGGERQRVGIARAVLRDPKLLILDEATSHLDTESERLITEATNNLIKDRTTVIIAHRLSTVVHADMIAVFDKGRIEATGTHAQLLKGNATYKKLCAQQFADA